MKLRVRKNVWGIAWLSTLVYFTSYLLRKSFEVMLVSIGDDLGVADTELAIVVTGLTIFYCAGQLINGFLGDRISPKWMILCGLILAVSSNIALFFCHSIAAMTAAWCINGFANAMLWAPIVRLFSIYLTDREYSYAMIRLMWGSAFSTVFLRLVCPAFLKIGLGWRGIILVFAGVGALVTLTFFLFEGKCFKDPVVTVMKTEDKQKKGGVPLPRMVWLPTILIMLGILTHGMLRDGVDNWIPTFLHDTFGIPAENAILVTVIVAVAGVLSISLFDYLHRRFFHNEVFCSAVTFAFSTLAAGVLYCINGRVSSMWLTLLLMMVISLSMRGINLMLITIVPKRYVKSGRISTFTGILDAAAYVGSALATYGFAAITETAGWSATILSWVIISAIGLVACLIATASWTRFRREYADNPRVG